MEHVSLIERLVIQEILGAADARFLSVAVFDGEELALKASNDFQRIKQMIGRTDETTLHFETASGAVIGSVLLVHGNDWDVISNYSDNPAMLELLASANAMADREAVRHV